MTIVYNKYLEILQTKFPHNVVTAVNGENYADIQWNEFDTSVKPTQAELDALLADPQLKTIEEVPTYVVNNINYLTTHSNHLSAYDILPMSGNTTIPYDNTIPLITEGTQLISIHVTPPAVDTKIVFDVNFKYTLANSSRYLIISLFRNNTCVGVDYNNTPAANKTASVNFRFTDMPATTDVVTYTLRVGVNSSTTWRINQEASSYFQRLANKSVCTVEFIKG